MDFALLFHQTGDVDAAEIMVMNPRFTTMHLGEKRFPGDVLVLNLQRAAQ
jgi:hypothetical protein